MMGYLFLAIALFCGVTKGYCGKKSGGTLAHASDAMLVNTVRMVFCIIIGLGIALWQSGGQLIVPDGKTLVIAALSGVSTALFAVSWLLSVRQGAYMMVDVFLLIGVVLPLLLCRFLFGEPIRPVQWGGILLLMIAGYVMCTYNASVKGKMTPQALALLILCAAANGITDFSQKLFVKTTEGDAAVFNLWTYLFAALVLAVCCGIFRRREKKQYALQPPMKIVQPILGYVLVMAVCLFLHSYFKTRAAAYLTAAQIYPLSQGGSVVLSMLMSALLFRERINAKCICGVVLSFAALLMINLL